MAGWQKRKITDAMTVAFGAGANDSGYREMTEVFKEASDTLKEEIARKRAVNEMTEYPGMAASPSLDDEIVDAEIVEDET
jgi:hypothetical protein